MTKYARLNEISEKLAEANVLIHSISDEILGKRRHFEFIALLEGKNANLTHHQRHIFGLIPQQQLELMRYPQSVMEELFVEFTPLLKKQCRKIEKKVVHYTAAELLGEAWIIFRKAVYGYCRKEFKFVSYLIAVLRRQLNRYVLQNRVGGLHASSNCYLTVLWTASKIIENMQKDGCRISEEDVFENFPEELKRKRGTRAMLTGVLAEFTPLSEALQIGVIDKNLELSQEISKEDIDKILQQGKVCLVVRKMLLAKLDDKSNTEIANQFNTTKGTVNKRIKTALLKLRKIA